MRNFQVDLVITESYRTALISLILSRDAQVASKVFPWKSITLMHVIMTKLNNQGYQNSAAQAQIKTSRHDNASIDCFTGLVQ
jgi:hypothetical protein